MNYGPGDRVGRGNSIYDEISVINDEDPDKDQIKVMRLVQY